MRTRQGGQHDQHVLRDPAHFSAANALSPVTPFTPEAQQILIDGGYTLKPALTNNDPPGHTRVRSHINKVFSARRIAPLVGSTHSTGTLRI
jgi:cytochrome P450